MNGLILIADDEPVSRLLACRYLEQYGYETLTAENGVEALELARKHLPDLILADALMPKLDGREMCKRLKEDPATRQIKIIIVTATYTKAKYKFEAMKSFHADGYLIKPLDIAQLNLLLETLLIRPHQPTPGIFTDTLVTAT